MLLFELCAQELLHGLLTQRHHRSSCWIYPTLDWVGWQCKLSELGLNALLRGFWSNAWLAAQEEVHNERVRRGWSRDNQDNVPAWLG